MPKRQPLHARGHPRGNTRIIGGNNTLNAKAVKVLAAVKFSPSSIGREDIMEKTSLSAEDVERQVKLLLQLNLFKKNSQFPQFPLQGWRVYTSQEDHLRITNILNQHGMEDPRVIITKRELGDYYNVLVGMYLEGDGIQPDRGGGYSKGICVVPLLDFKPEALAVMAKFRDEIHPFRPKEYSEQAVEEKKLKWKWFVKEMSRVYHIPEPRVTFGVFSRDSWNRKESSANDDNGNSSSYNRATNTLFFTGRFSLVTLLHEFAHARGFDERDAICWSQNIGLRTFPVTINRLIEQSDPNTHMLTRNDETQERFDL